MRVLIESYSAACRGSYGIVTKNVWERILAAEPGIEVIQHGWFHIPSDRVPWPIYPTQDMDPASDARGERTFEPMVAQSRPDLVWYLADPWHNQETARIKSRYGYRLLHYCPVDSEPYPAGYAPAIAGADRIVTMTDFGKRVLLGCPGLGERRIDVIPHGHDPEKFHAFDKEGKKKAKAMVAGRPEAPKKTILGWVGRDQFRKQVWQLFELMHYIRSGEWVRCKTCGRVTVKEYDTLARQTRDPKANLLYPKGYAYLSCSYCASHDLAEGKPRDDVELWTHMLNKPDRGWDLSQLAWIYRVHDVVYNPAGNMDDRGVPVDALNVFYNAIDLFVFPSGGEGFGLPVLEAMACGVPVVYSDYSGHAEFAAGRPVRVRLFPETSQRYRALCDMGDLVRQTLDLVDDRNERAILGKRALKTAAQMTWDAFTDRWLEVIHATMEKSPTRVFGAVA